MAPNVSVHFWDANDPNNTTPILEITDEDEFFRGFKITPDLYALGGWELQLARRVGFALFDSGAVQPEVFVRYLIHAYSDTVYYGGGPLRKRNQTVIHREESGEEVFIFGGPGPKAAMDRYRLGIEQLTGTGWNLDLENGVWRWKETATAGRVLNRVIAEDAAQTDPALPFLAKSFGDATDSNGDAWTADIATSDDYEIPIGTSLLEVIFELEDLSDLVTTVHLGEVGAPEYRLDAWNAYGEDVTGTSFGTGVCLLREGDNIANDSLVVEGVALRKATHVIIEGKDGVWATKARTGWSSGDYIKWEKIEYPRSSNVTILERAGLRWLRRQDNGDRLITVEIVPGASESAGLYFPGPGEVLWLGNTVTLDTAEDGSTHTPLDYTNEDQLVTGFEIELGPAGDTSSADAKAKSWDVKVKLNGERGGQAQAPRQGTTGSPGKCECGKQIQLCEVHVPGTPASEIITPVKAFNADSDGGDALTWSGLLSNQVGGAAGSSHYYFKSALPDEWSQVYAVSAGVTLRITGFGKDLTSTDLIKIGFFNAGVGSSGNNANLIGSATNLLVAPASGWTAFTVEVTTPAGTVGFALGRLGGVSFDQVAISTVTVDPGDGGIEGVCPEDVGLECASGTMACAARGDHVHAHGLLSDSGTHHHSTGDIEGYAAGGGTWEDAVTALGGKVHRWKFEEASGFPQDSVGTLHVTSGGGTITRGVASPLGNAMSMTAAMATTGIGSLPTGGNGRTVIAVRKSTSAESGVHRQILSYGPTGTTRQWFDFCLSHDSFAQVGQLFWADDHKPGYWAGDGTYRLIITSYHNRAVNLWVDGQHIYSGTTGAAISTGSTGNAAIGADVTTLTDLIVLNRWITQNEIDALWDALYALL